MVVVRWIAEVVVLIVRKPEALTDEVILKLLLCYIPSPPFCRIYLTTPTVVRIVWILKWFPVCCSITDQLTDRDRNQVIQAALQDLDIRGWNQLSENKIN